MRGVAIAVSVFVSSCAWADVGSSFDTSAEGWSALSDNLEARTPIWFPTGGDPGGHIEQPDFGTGSWFFVAPPSYLGDLSAYRGGALSMSLRSVAVTNPSTENDDFVIEGAEGTLTLDLETAANPTDQWTRLTLRLDHLEGWTYTGPHGGLSHFEQVGMVLADVTAIRIRGDWGDGPDLGLLDSVLLAAPCNAADFAEPLGMLDFFDVQRFLNRFDARDPSADLNGDGAWDFFDAQSFLNAFSAGCP